MGNLVRKVKYSIFIVKKYLDKLKYFALKFLQNHSCTPNKITLCLFMWKKRIISYFQGWFSANINKKYTMPLPYMVEHLLTWKWPNQSPIWKQNKWVWTKNNAQFIPIYVTADDVKVLTIYYLHLSISHIHQSKISPYGVCVVPRIKSASSKNIFFRYHQ